MIRLWASIQVDCEYPLGETTARGKCSLSVNWEGSESDMSASGISNEELKEEELAHYRREAEELIEEFLETAPQKEGSLFVVGCSSSEAAAHAIGSFSNAKLGKAIFEGIYSVLKRHGIYLAAQCCEHLNRALIVESAAAERYGLEPVNAVPFPKAGGSFAAAAYEEMEEPVAVEYVRAAAGIDIGDTLIGMHLKEVAVPVRLKKSSLGAAHVVCARTRPRYIGGERTHYDEHMK